MPCKHLAAVCYVLAEEFDRDPFGMLAWRGKGRDELLAALRRIQAAGTGPGQDAPAGRPARPRPGLDVPAPPLEECLDGFWSPGLSPARLRALATAPDAAAPDLLLRMFPPPPVQVRGKDLADVLAPAYQQFAADDRPALRGRSSIAGTGTDGGLAEDMTKIPAKASAVKVLLPVLLLMVIGLLVLIPVFQPKDSATRT